MPKRYQKMPKRYQKMPKRCQKDAKMPKKIRKDALKISKLQIDIRKKLQDTKTNIKSMFFLMNLSKYSPKYEESQKYKIYQRVFRHNRTCQKIPKISLNFPKLPQDSNIT